MEEATAKRGLACRRFEKAVQDFSGEIVDQRINDKIVKELASDICRAVTEALESYESARDYASNGFGLKYVMGLGITSSGIKVEGIRHEGPKGIGDGAQAIPAPPNYAIHAPPFLVSVWLTLKSLLMGLCMPYWTGMPGAYT